MKRIIYVHGNSSMPEKEVLRDLWCDAIVNGLYSDYGDIAVERFGDIDSEFIYYGDLLNQSLGISEDALGGQKYQDILRDITNKQKRKLKELIALRQNDISNHRGLKERAALQKNLDYGIPYSDQYLRGAADDISFNDGDSYGYDSELEQLLPRDSLDGNSLFDSDVTLRLFELLLQKLKNHDDILLLTHGSGAIVSYNCLYSIGNEVGDVPADAAISKWIMLGAPSKYKLVKTELNWCENSCFPNNCKNLVNVVGNSDALSCKINTGTKQKYENSNLIETQVKSGCKIEKYKLDVNSPLEYLINPCVVKHIYEWVRS